MAGIGCVLRVSGADLDAEAVLQQTSLHACSIWHKDSQRPAQTRNRREDSGFAIDISDKENLKEQIQDAITFLTDRRTAVLNLMACPEVTRIELDFGIALRDSAAQFNRFPVPLIELAAEFKIDLVLSQYACD